MVFEATKTACEQWRAIGRKLKFDIEELDSITHESGRNFNTDYYEAMLKRWIEKDGATTETLSLALSSIGFESLACDFLSKMRVYKRPP